MVNTNEQASLLKFWAPWCSPCIAMTPAVHEAMKNHVVELKEINVDEDPDNAVKYEIRAIPTLVLVKDGEAVGKMVGLRTSIEIDKFLSSHGL